MGIKDGMVERGLELTLTYPSNAGELTAILRVTDRASSTVIAEIELTADQFTALMGSKHIVVKGMFTDRTDRLGKEMEVGDVRFGHYDEDGKPWTDDRIAVTSEDWRRREGFETVTFGRVGGGGGYRAVGRRWVEPKEESD